MPDSFSDKRIKLKAHTNTPIYRKKIKKGERATSKFKTTQLTHKISPRHALTHTRRKKTVSEIQNHFNTSAHAHSHTHIHTRKTINISKRGKADQSKHNQEKRENNPYRKPAWPTENRSNWKHEWVQVSLSTPH